MKRHLTALVLLGLALPLGAAPAAVQPTLDERLQRIERMLRNQSLSDIVLRLQRLQQEVQELRGQLEIQSHAIDAIKRRQRELYLDVDNRLNQLQQGGGNAALAAQAGMAGAESAAKLAPSVAEAAAGKGASKGSRGKVSKQEPAPAGGKESEEDAYQRSFNLLRQGRYDDAIAAFQRFLTQYPGSEFADNAQYWLAESYYVNQNFDQALKGFQTLMEKYSTSPKVPGAMLKIGYIHQERKEWNEAKAAFEDLIKRYPDSAEARLAKKRLEHIAKR